MITSTYSKDLILLEVLDLSQTRCHQDVTIVCSNGTVNSNSFLLASIFPVFRRALETTIQCQDPWLILIPDLDVMDLETFLQHPQENHSKMSISKDVRDLLQLQLDTAIKEEVCHFEDIADIENYSDRYTNIEMESKIPCELCGTLWNSKEAGKSDLFFSSCSLHRPATLTISAMCVAKVWNTISPKTRTKDR